jgi:hypothetical protein
MSSCTGPVLPAIERDRHIIGIISYLFDAPGFRAGDSTLSRMRFIQVYRHLVISAHTGHSSHATPLITRNRTFCPHFLHRRTRDRSVHISRSFSYLQSFVQPRQSDPTVSIPEASLIPARFRYFFRPASECFWLGVFRMVLGVIPDTGARCCRARLIRRALAMSAGFLEVNFPPPSAGASRLSCCP